MEGKSNMMPEKKMESDVMLGFKNTYLDIIDQSVTLSKKMFGAAFDAETDMIRKLGEHDPIINQNIQMFESVTKDANLGIKNMRAMMTAFADASIAWQKVALDSQKAAIQTYANWVESFRAYVPKN